MEIKWVRVWFIKGNRVIMLDLMKPTREEGESEIKRQYGDVKILGSLEFPSDRFSMPGFFS